MELTSALAGDDVAKSRRAAAALQRTAGEARSGALTAEDEALFHRLMGDVASQAAGVSGGSLEEIRAALPKISAAVEQYLRTFGHNRETPLYRLFCPMAFNNKGAFWLSPGPEILNPYFGTSMLRCGEVKGRIGPDGKESR
jgi:Cu(I)/Ag(I) efflux system membrane fusion protein